jgi:hypothetical protein
MASSSSLTCNFTISATFPVGVTFQSENGGMNYGGQITISTPANAGPVTTGLWDDDGNVCFTIYDIDAPVSCTVNSGSDPGSWTPYVTVGESGLTCVVSPPEQTGPSTYNYTLTVAQAPAPPPPPPTSGAEADASLGAAPAPQHVATMTLPAGGKAAWTAIMGGGVPVPDEINPGAPIVMAVARFDDGTQVVGGVYKYTDPTQYNVKFMWVFDADGSQYPGWPIDVSDDEDFDQSSYAFALPPGGTVANYLLTIVEAQPQERAQ